MLKILYYSWNETSREDMVEALQKQGCSVTVASFPLCDYLNDPVFESSMNDMLNKTDYDFLYTFNYFPILSKLAQERGLPYVCWVFDCPNLTLYSTTVPNDCNYIFVFDRCLQQQALSCGGKHVYHLPLAANTSRLNRQLSLAGGLDSFALPQEEYSHDVSFVGSLYENNQFSQIRYLPDSLRGYLDGVMAAQKQIWGTELVSELVDDSVAAEISKYVKLDPHPDYTYTDKAIYTSFILKKITSDERIRAIRMSAKSFHTTLYSASPKDLCPEAACGGYISYQQQMPLVFRRSRINLNITLRSITSGIPLRALDVFACGGFLLSNYQPELCEYFIPDEDFVYYEDFNDMLDKIQFYLSHDAIRTEIAYNGWKKTSEMFSYDIQVFKLLTSVMGQIK